MHNKIPYVGQDIAGQTRQAYKRRNDRTTPSSHPIVNVLFAEMRRQRMTLTELSRRSGVHRDAISEWPKRNSPRITNIEACLNALGLELVVRERE